MKGESAEITTEINKLFSFGIIASIPEDWKEDENYIRLITYRKNFLNGLLSMAQVSMQFDEKLMSELKGQSYSNRRAPRKKKSVAAWKAIAVARASKIGRQFIRTSSFTPEYNRYVPVVRMGALVNNADSDGDGGITDSCFRGVNYNR